MTTATAPTGSSLTNRFEGHVNEPTSHRRFVVLLSAAVVTSALHRAPFVLPARFLVVDLLIVMLVLMGLTALLASAPQHPAYVAVLAGIWVLALGYLIGMSVEGLSVQAIGVLGRELLPPFVFLVVVARLARAQTWSWRPCAAAGLAIIVVVVSLVIDGNARAKGTFRNPNYAAHFLIVATFLVAITPWRVWAKAALTLLAAGGVFLTGSFGALATAAAAIGYLMFAAPSRVDQRLRVVLRALALLIFGALAYLAKTGALQESFDAGQGFDSARLDRSGNGRFSLWHEVIQLWNSHRAGIGFATSIDRQSLTSLIGVPEPHSNYLSALLNGGLLAVVGLIVVVVGTWRLGSAGGPTRTLVLATAVSGIFRQTWNFRHAWLALAIVCAYEMRRTTDSSLKRTGCVR